MASNLTRFRGVLADIRVEALNLRRELLRIETLAKDASSGDAPDEPKLKALEARLKTGKTVFDVNKVDIENLIATATKLTDEDGDVDRADDGCLDAIGNSLQNLTIHWPVRAEPARASPVVVTERVQECLENIRAILIAVARVNAASDLNAYMAVAGPLQAIDFNDLFRGDLPDEEDRRAVLEYLAGPAAAFKGVFIDEPKGLVYRTGWPTRELAITYGLLLAVWIAGLVLVWAVGSWSAIESVWPDSVKPATSNKLVDLYLAVSAGALIHVFVDLRKARQIASDSPLSRFGISAWIVWGYQQRAKIIVSIGGLVAVAVGLVAIEQIAIITALFAGYSLDSVLDVFIKRLTDTAAQEVLVLQGGGVP